MAPGRCIHSLTSAWSNWSFTIRIITLHFKGKNNQFAMQAYFLKKIRKNNRPSEKVIRFMIMYNFILWKTTPLFNCWLAIFTSYYLINIVSKNQDKFKCLHGQNLGKPLIFCMNYFSKQTPIFSLMLTSTKWVLKICVSLTLIILFPFRNLGKTWLLIFNN